MFSNTTKKLSTTLEDITPIELSKLLNSHLENVKEPLKIIYNLINTNYNNIHDQFIDKHIKISIKKVKQPKDKLDTIVFLNKQDKHNIIQLPITYKYEVLYKTNKLKIIVTSKKKPNMKFIYRVFSKCFLLLDLFAVTVHNRVYNIYVWLSGLKKTKPLYKREYKATHINSGATVHKLLDDINFETDFEKVRKSSRRAEPFMGQFRGYSKKVLGNNQQISSSKNDSSKKQFDSKISKSGDDLDIKIDFEISKFEKIRKKSDKNIQTVGTFPQLVKETDIDISKNPFRNKFDKRELKTKSPVELYIWREEEFEKVLIHELIHTLKLDFMTYPDNLTEDVANAFNLSNAINIHVGEAYVETWAIIFNSILISKSLTKFFEIFEKEVLFSLFQTSKVIHHFGYNCFTQCEMSLVKAHDTYIPEIGGRNKENNDENSATYVAKFLQDTSVFSYFILKTGILLHIDEFIRFCVIHNDNLIDFRQSAGNFREFNKILLLISQNTEGSQLLQNAYELYTLYLKNKSNNRKLLHNTMRMSLHELK
jgi:hypothetical protein